MLKCIISDDETPAREEIKYFLMKDGEFDILAECENGIETVNAVNSLKPHILFCDIEMPLMNGIEVGKTLFEGNQEVFIVYVTAYGDYVIQALEANALDYILKPIQESRFDVMLKKIKFQLGQKKSNLEEIHQIQERNDFKPNQLCLYKEGIIYPVKPEEIIYIHTEEKLTQFFTQKGVFENYKSLSEIESYLPGEDFFKCNRANIINIHFIEAIIPWFNRTFHIKLKGIEEEISVSRQHSVELKNKFQIFY